MPTTPLDTRCTPDYDNLVAEKYVECVKHNCHLMCSSILFRYEKNILQLDDARSNGTAPVKTYLETLNWKILIQPTVFIVF